ncbi:hypothetical protein [uncultured Kordia sp.]|uniref:hypothetical protein n=1 Tax=uncultured Kordia sp. TaxID=507699 RepID=UPI002631ED61|nr:hypothetical protein [uncultured Kordia sp.]
MKTTQTTTKYIEWISAEDMHTDSLHWLSQLRFIKDEHHFFEHLIATFSRELQELDIFSSDKEIIDAITRSFRKTKQLIQIVVTHEKELTIMLDAIDQPEDEKKYKETHRQLTLEIASFLKEYRSLKTQLFRIIKDIKKEDKLRSLFDKNH